jgi:hypothetical protein
MPNVPTIPESRIWRGSLPDLFAKLVMRAAELGGRWAWYALPRGAIVSLRRVGAAGALELRIARGETPATAEGLRAWEVELGVFLRYFGGRDAWEPITLEDPVLVGTGIAAAFRAKPVPAPPLATCAKCGVPVHDGGLYRENLCTRCAMEAGTREAQARGHG